MTYFMTPIDFGGQWSKVKVTIDIFDNKLVNTIETTVVCFFVKLGRHASHRERIDPIGFGGQRSRSR